MKKNYFHIEIGAVFLAISSLVPCGNKPFSLQHLQTCPIAKFQLFQFQFQKFQNSNCNNFKFVTKIDLIWVFRQKFGKTLVIFEISYLKFVQMHAKKFQIFDQKYLIWPIKTKKLKKLVRYLKSAISNLPKCKNSCEAINKKSIRDQICLTCVFLGCNFEKMLS